MEVLGVDERDGRRFSKVPEHPFDCFGIVNNLALDTSDPTFAENNQVKHSVTPGGSEDCIGFHYLLVVGDTFAFKSHAS